MAVQSVLGPLGVSKAPYGSFAGKVQAGATLNAQPPLRFEVESPTDQEFEVETPVEQEWEVETPGVQTYKVTI